MKANEFVKKHGWEKSKSIIINAHHKATHFYCGWMELVDYFYKHVNLGWCKVDSRTIGWDSDRCCYDVHPPISSMFVIDDLKSLIESHELVEECGGLNSLKAWVKETKSEVSLATYFHCNKPSVLIRIENAEKAIADVESCQ